jgi:hypothetical protein
MARDTAVEHAADGTSGVPAAVLEGFLGPDRCRQVADFAEEVYRAGEMFRNVFQAGAWVANLDQRHTLRPHDPCWDVVQRLRETVVGALGIQTWREDAYLKEFFSYISAGGFIVRHRDDWQLERPDLDCRVRCNVFVQKEPGSGDPCLGAEELAEGAHELRLGLSAGDLLAFSPSMTLHRATRVIGQPKILVSFGFLITQATFRQVLERLRSTAQWRPLTAYTKQDTGFSSSSGRGRASHPSSTGTS